MGLAVNLILLNNSSVVFITVTDEEENAKTVNKAMDQLRLPFFN